VIEAELKARLRDPAAVRGRLDALAEGRPATYWDAYFDTPNAALDDADLEVRLRTITDAAGERHLLTFKEPAVDEQSRSKPEHETQLSNPDAVTVMLQALGLDVAVEFTKECVNYDFESDGRRFAATVARVPELDGVFLEVETKADDGELEEALAAVRGVLAVLGVSEDELTTDTYTDAVTAARTGT
jgi:adenylate cyclase class 2